MQDFDEIYAAYFSEVYGFVLTLCRNPDLAEEITQETFFKALKGIDRFRGNCKISTWLCQIAKNTCYTVLRQRSASVAIVPDEVPSPEDVAERFADRETAYEAVQALHRLKEPYREVFWLRTFGELKFSQIGTLFEKTESWARVTYYRAKYMIKEELT